MSDSAAIFGGPPLLNSQLEDGAARGDECGAEVRRTVPARGPHRHGQPGSGVVLQQAWNGGAIDQRMSAGGEDDAAALTSVPVE